MHHAVALIDKRYGFFSMARRRNNGDFSPAEIDGPTWHSLSAGGNARDYSALKPFEADLTLQSMERSVLLKPTKATVITTSAIHAPRMAKAAPK